MRFLPTALILLCFPAAFSAGDPLPSWAEGTTKERILSFVDAAEDIPVPERVAVFDNDGTLWSEHPMYVQGIFAFDRVRSLAPRHPEWKKRQPFRAVLENDVERLKRLTEADLAKIIAVSHSGMSPEEFTEIARNWLKTAKHPTLGMLYKDCVYQPMLELLAYLRKRGFKTYIVSGGGVDFLRAFAEETYGVPPEQVIGSSGKTKFVLKDGRADLLKLPKLGIVDDGDGKPININLHIGRRPVLAFGNSDGDLAMLQYTASNRSPTLQLLLHHDDDKREFAYDRDTNVGRLDKALDEARSRGWEVVSMKEDFAVIFPTRTKAVVATPR